MTVFRSTAVMAVGTVVSRITGMVRNLLVVAALGTAIFADTFNVANTIPTILYILLIGGALNSVFVPQLVRSMNEDDDGGAAFASRLLTATAILLGAITVAAVLLAPLLVRIYASKFSSVGFEHEYALTVVFARYCLPQIFFLGLFVMFGQVANSRDRFGPMMWAPVLNNLVVISSLLVFLKIAPHVTSRTITSGETALLGLGTTTGVALQFLILVPVVVGLKVRLKPRFDWRGGGIGHSSRLAFWTFCFVLVNQIGYLVVVNIATAASVKAKALGLVLGVGFTTYANAYLIFVLPHSIFTVSLVTALLPRISAAAADKRIEEVRNEISTALKMIGVATVPAAIAFLSFGPLIATVLYAGTDPVNARQIGYVLAGFSLGLIPFSANHLLLRGFYAFEDTKTPVGINLILNTVMVVLSLIAHFFLPLRWVVVGLAGAFALAYFVSIRVTLKRLGKHIGSIGGSGILRTHVRLGLASVLAMIPAYAIAHILGTFIGKGALGSLLTLAVSGPTFLGLYLLLARKLRIVEVDLLFVRLRAITRRGMDSA
ncbi:MAG TPA: murein biosynthesis integral membrane protein MurJ [Candidatus Nanopelagicaceae bacterium]|nr:murein biosynthesis integral membrane protein MurJ [Candidatus Nanopelagicaceae bacterium]